jgi:hypothetical protein
MLKSRCDEGRVVLMFWRDLLWQVRSLVASGISRGRWISRGKWDLLWQVGSLVAGEISRGRWNLVRRVDRCIQRSIVLG